MKEVENIDEVENVNGVENKNKVKQKVHTLNFTALYEKLSDIPSRLRFLVDMRKTIVARNAINEEVSQKERDEADRLLNSFVKKYITNGSIENQRLVFETLGSINAENNYDCYREYDNQLNYSEIPKRLLPTKKEQLEKVAKWMMDQSSAGMENRAINEISSALKMAFNENDKKDITLWKNAKINEKTTMKEYAIKCGVDKEHIEDFLRKKNVSGDVKLYDFYKKNNNVDKVNKSDLMSDFSLDCYKSWMKNGVESEYRKNNISDRKREIIDDIAHKNHIDNSYQSLKDWPEKVGEEYVKDRRKKEAHNVLNAFKGRYNEGLRDNIKEDKLIWDMRIKYSKIDSMEGKLDFIIDCVTKSDIRDMMNVPYKDIHNFVYNLVDDFAKNYVLNANPQTAQKAFELIGKKTVDNTCELMGIDSAYRDEFKNEGKTGIKKADALAWRSIPGLKARPLKQITRQMITRFQQNSMTGLFKWQNSNLSTDSTIEKYAKQIGIEDNKIQDYLENYNIAPGTKLIDSIIDKDAKDDPLKALKDLEARFCNDVCNVWLDKGSQDVISTFDKSKTELFKDITNKINTEISFTGGVGEWLDGPGKKRYDDIRDCSVTLIEKKSEPVDKKTKNYDNYIKLHTGEDVLGMSSEHQKDCLIKSLTAQFLKNSGKEFKVSTIHKYAEMLKERSEVQELISNKEAFRKALSSPENLLASSNDIFGNAYEVSPENVSRYIKDMHELSQNMMSSKGRSKEYKAFSNAVNKIASLYGKYDLTIEADRIACSKELRGLNFDLVTSTQNYITDKKSVRISRGGNDRFDNALDAFAIISKNSTNLKDFIKKQIDSINKEREYDNDELVDIRSYGAKRAAEAKKLREPKKKEKKVVEKNTAIIK